MRYTDIKRHLIPYSIHKRRKTTVNHAFAAAIAPCDDFVETRIRESIQVLGQNPDRELTCVYCDEPAQTWDHVHATVKDSCFSGAGHRVGNLLPCCKPCNSSKGNRSWEMFIQAREPSGPSRDERIARIRGYLETFFKTDPIPNGVPEYERLLEIRDEVLRLMREADGVAEVIRNRMKDAGQTSHRQTASPSPHISSDNPR